MRSPPSPPPQPSARLAGKATPGGPGATPPSLPVIHVCFTLSSRLPPPFPQAFFGIKSVPWGTTITVGLVLSPQPKRPQVQARPPGLCWAGGCWGVSEEGPARPVDKQPEFKRPGARACPPGLRWGQVALSWRQPYFPAERVSQGTWRLPDQPGPSFTASGTFILATGQSPPRKGGSPGLSWGAAGRALGQWQEERQRPTVGGLSWVHA